MAKFDRLTVLNAAVNTGLFGLFYNDDLEVSKNVAHALADGGVRILEFTNRGDRAWNVFDELIVYVNKNIPEMIVGVGSVADPATAAQFINSGANFVVGPMLNPDVAKLCNRRKIAYMPGCGTLSEISYAEELGCEIVKAFPGSTLGGPKFIKAALAPMPWTRIMPTGGVSATEANIKEWIRAGAACLGMGSDLVSKAALASGDYAKITETAKQCLAWIQEARAE